LIRARLGGLERRLGCGTASLLQILLGKADLYFGLGERIWDVCAVVVIAEELGFKHSIEWSSVVESGPFDFVCGAEPLFGKALKEVRSNNVPFCQDRLDCRK
jgi:myo-inositol-1(or 4)-monophosphatase